MKKRILTILAVAVLCTFFAGCVNDTSLFCPGHMDLVKAPDKLIYVIGRDTELDISGGYVRLINFEGNELETEDMGKLTGEYVFTDADFNKEGIYLVKVGLENRSLYKDLFFQYTIQVVSPESELAGGAQ